MPRLLHALEVADLLGPITGIRGMHLPLEVHDYVINSKYVDDRALYVEDDDESLGIVRVALDTFCTIASAKIVPWHVPTIRVLGGSH